MSFLPGYNFLENVLGGFQQARQNKKLAALGSRLNDDPLMSPLANILQQPGGAEFIQQYGGLLKPILEKHAEAVGPQEYLKNMGVGGQSGQTLLDGTLEESGGSMGTGGSMPQLIDILESSPYEVHQKKAERLHQEKLAQQKREQTRQWQLEDRDRDEFNKFAAPFDDSAKIRNRVQKAHKAMDLIRSGQISFDKNIAHNLSQWILGGQRFEDLQKAFRTPEQQALWAFLRPFLDTREVGGSNPSTKEMEMTKQTLPDIFNTQEGNEIIMNEIERSEETKSLIADAITEARANKNYSVADLQKIIAEHQEELDERYDKQHREIRSRAQAKKAVKDKKLPQGHMWITGEGDVAHVPDNEENRREVKERGWSIVD